MLSRTYIHFAKLSQNDHSTSYTSGTAYGGLDHSADNHASMEVDHIDVHPGGGQEQQSNTISEDLPSNSAGAGQTVADHQWAAENAIRRKKALEWLGTKPMD